MIEFKERYFGPELDVHNIDFGFRTTLGLIRRRKDMITNEVIWTYEILSSGLSEGILISNDLDEMKNLIQYIHRKVK